MIMEEVSMKITFDTKLYDKFFIKTQKRLSNLNKAIIQLKDLGIETDYKLDVNEQFHKKVDAIIEKSIKCNA